MKYIIEFADEKGGNWDDNVGDGNEFASYEEAYETAKELQAIFLAQDGVEYEFRIQEEEEEEE